MLEGVFQVFPAKNCNCLTMAGNLAYGLLKAKFRCVLRVTRGILTVQQSLATHIEQSRVLLVYSLRTFTRPRDMIRWSTSQTNGAYDVKPETGTRSFRFEAGVRGQQKSAGTKIEKLR